MDTRTAIKQNLVYLEEKITNLSRILSHLIQNGTISQNERDEIEAERTPQAKNSKLLGILQRKELPMDIFLEILSATNNSHCVHKIEGLPSKNEHPMQNICETRNPLVLQSTVAQILKNKWWPDKKRLIKSLHKRKFEGRFIIEELHDRISGDENRMIVLCESVEASKLTGMGGVGKTLTATWYGHHYEEEYDHVIWIDCGEDSLLKSFQILARDLNIKNRDEFVDLEDCSRKCYETLEQFKCLWIFDNAESYRGDEGIKEVLPKFKKSFYCVITSRSLDWGTPNIGHGNVSRLELSIFGESESLEFLKTHLNDEIQHTEHQLKELSRLLGNLPLALQLAVAALNVGKIDLQNYIEETSSKDLGSIVDTKFDDYEKTINGSIQISLHLIEKEKNGKVAKDILNIVGYIRPDNIQAKLLMKIMKVNIHDLKGAIDLLEKYSLASKSGTVQETPYDGGIINKLFGRNQIIVEMDLLSIHRLLQQVIRHNCRKSENETLRKILGCDGFLDYKLLPFTKYASDKLRKEFPKVRAQLLDQKQLKKLLKEKRFEESVQLANFIDKELNSSTTKFNYAVCLCENGQLEEAVNVLTPLFGKHKSKKKDVTISAEGIGLYGNIVDLSVEPTIGQIGSFLLHLYLQLDRIPDFLKENTHGIVQMASKGYLNYLLEKNVLPEAVQLAKLIDKELNTMTTKLNYAVCLVENGQLEEAVKVLTPLLRKHKTKKDVTNEEGAVKTGEDAPKKNVDRILQIATKGILNYLIENEEFKEAAQLANFIDKEINTNTSKFNYAICLEKNQQFKEGIKVLEEVYKQQMKEEMGYYDDDYIVEMGLLKLEKDVTKDLVGGQLLVSLWTIDYNNERLKEILEERKSFVVVHSEKMTTPLVRILYPNLIHSNYTLRNEGRMLRLVLGGTKKRIELNYCSVDLCGPLLRALSEMQKSLSERVHFTDGNPKDTKSEVSQGIPKILNTVQVHCYKVRFDKRIPTIAIRKVYWRWNKFKNSLLSKQVDRESNYYLFHEGKGKAIEKKDFNEFYEQF